MTPMTPMTASDRAALHERLEHMKQQAIAELSDSASMGDRRTEMADREVTSHADEAEAERAADVDSAEMEVDRLRLEDVELALIRMSNGSYGTCPDCGVDIPRQRLLAQPTAIRCTSCQMLAERRMRK